ncbi:MAG: TonB-dependent receptor [Phenylobacterium sp.]|uniref:TonB-dependent receptor n=1 Tax=Phenylobacterium sp. TaxID=1871053 RepID=UPI001A5EF3B1|nr:TonB-dependent receptor [Phenylobacterium sp.]MBL8554389.1 TonB-dependent receptor [Phenylobacterium sp.]
MIKAALSHRAMLLSSAVLSACALAGAAQAQAADETAVEEVVVTAQKRTERLQDVPLAVTAVTSDALQARQVNDTNSLTQAVPSLTFQQGSNPGNTSFRIRGIGSALFGQGAESAVSVVVDGVVAARQSQGFADFADIERIEVLRGPQGTLFGRNATAGVINVVTRAPSSDFEGAVESTWAEGQEYRVRGTMSGPLTEALKGRLTGYYNDVGGIARNVVTGRKVNGYESWGARGKLLWDATEDLKITAAADYRENDALCCAFVPIQIVNPVVAQLTRPVVASRDNRALPENEETRARTLQATYSLQADWDLGFATVTSITAKQHYNLDQALPVDRIDSTPVRFVGPAAYAAFDVNGGTINLGNLTQELRIASNGERALTYVAGVFYSDLHIDRHFDRRNATCVTGVVGQPCAAPVFQSSFSDARLNAESIAAFGQAEYRVTDGLKLIAGLRVQKDEVSVRGARNAPLVPGDRIFPGNNPISGKVSASDTGISGKAGVQYEFSRNAQAYATYTRGYKGLALDTEITANFAAQPVVRPETVDAYEVGFKGRTADGALSVAAAVFLADYSNLQVNANRSDPNTGVIAFVTTNAGSSTTKGVEIEASWRPSRLFTLDAGLTYADSSIDLNGANCPLQFQAAAQTLTGNFPVNTCYRRSTTVNGVTTVSGPLQDIRDGRLPAGPRWRINVAPRLEHEILDTGFTGFIQTVVAYQSAQSFSLEQDPLVRQKAYTLVDVTVGVRSPDDRYTVRLFVKNLFDVNYFTSVAHNGLLATAASPLDLVAVYNKDADRYVGATLGLKF